MSIDPASSIANLPPGVDRLSMVNFSQDAIYAFDFDGVLSSSFEDDIYHMPSWDGEESLLIRAEANFHINLEGMEKKYRRHLIYQAAAWRCGLKIEEGPGLKAAIEAQKNSKIFILTARSGWYAVERMRLFLSSKGIMPIEIFNVGRVRKGGQLSLICSEFEKSNVIYIEDNISHIAFADSLEISNLKIVFTERLSDKISAEILRQNVIKTIESAIESF